MAWWGKNFRPFPETARRSSPFKLTFIRQNPLEAEQIVARVILTPNNAHIQHTKNKHGMTKTQSTTLRGICGLPKLSRKKFESGFAIVTITWRRDSPHYISYLGD